MINIKKTIGIPRALLYYYDKDLWLNFFKYLGYKTILSPPSNKQILKNGEKIANDEACLSLKLYLGHVLELKNRCDVILIPRLFSIKKNEQVCTNFNCLYDLTRNLIDTEIVNYNIDLSKNDTELKAFINLGKLFEESYIRSYKAYKYAKKIQLNHRLEKEKAQAQTLKTSKLKILIASHPYNLYDNLIGKTITDYLNKNDISILYSDCIDHTLIDSECQKLSTDIHWTHNKEILASASYYKDKVDGIIIISSFPCGPDSLANEMITRKIKNIPIINLVFEDLNSQTGLITRLESFIDILRNVKEHIYETNN